MSHKRNRRDDALPETIDSLLGDESSSDAGSPAETGDSAVGAQDPGFASPYEPNPFGADDLHARAAEFPATDKQGDELPSHRG